MDDTICTQCGRLKWTTAVRWSPTLGICSVCQDDNKELKKVVDGAVPAGRTDRAPNK